MRRTLIAGLTIAAFGLGTSPAFAAAIVNPDGSVTFNGDNGSNTVNIGYNGVGGDPTALIPGLSAFMTLTFEGVLNNVFTFSYTLQNTSSVTAARISGIGFDVNPDVVSISAGAGDLFNLVSLNQQFASAGVAETCFNGGPGSCPVSNPSNSLALGGTISGTLNFTLGDPANQSSITLSNFLDRYQGFTTTNVNGGTVTSAVGYGTPAVPEPATWAMMLLGFGGIGMATRRNRSRRSGTALMQIA
jgi:hypothetical protein